MTAQLSNVIGVPPGFRRALDTFRRAAREVPAYRRYLADRGVDAGTIRTPDDFATVPVMTKADYLLGHPRPSLLWDGTITAAGSWSTSSGSTGKPTYWPRAQDSLDDSAELYDRIFRADFGSDRRSTLLVVGFAMGTWIGGTYSHQAALELRKRGHTLSVSTPGIDADTILSTIAELGPDYEQVVLAGYPPFVQDVLDQASDAVRKQHVSVLLAGESITEQWRDHILRRLGAQDETDRIRLIYGTADAGVMGHETATTVAVRRLAATDERLAAALFGPETTLPTFVEYDPQLRYTEVDEHGRFLFTVDNTMPLIRYRINDQGSILSPWQVAETLRDFGYRVPIRTSGAGCGFLALHRRTDVAASFYAVKLYPDTIRAVLDEPDFCDLVTGKFVLAARSDPAFAQTLNLSVELRENVRNTAEFVDLLRIRVTAALDRTSEEYRRLHAALGTAAEPVVTLEPFGSSAFRYDVKHRYLEGDR